MSMIPGDKCCSLEKNFGSCHHGKLRPRRDSTFVICSGMVTFHESDLRTLFKVSIKLYHSADMTVKQLCMNLHFFRSLVSAMNIILGHYNLIILLELMV